MELPNESNIKKKKTSVQGKEVELLEHKSNFELQSFPQSRRI